MAIYFRNAPKPDATMVWGGDVPNVQTLFIRSPCRRDTRAREIDDALIAKQKAAG
ncbi:MAG: hypothetical protein ABSD08_17870 [Xanthobacteraceae bacterium]